MRNTLLLVMLCILGVGILFPISGWGDEEKGAGNPAVIEFRAFSQFKSVKLIWQSGLPASTAKSFQITRSIYYQEGPYTPLTSVEAKEGEGNYSFVDKDIKSSENYHYKITVEGTGETFGPAVAKPFLSQPAT